MLINSVWRQYNKENNFREILSKYCKIDIEEFIEDDKILYAILKAKLTKKELRLFAMDSAEIDDNAIKSLFSYDEKELEDAKFRLYKKLKQDKVRLEFKTSFISER